MTPFGFVAAAWKQRGTVEKTGSNRKSQLDIRLLNDARVART
jgi:hypothetical protein